MEWKNICRYRLIMIGWFLGICVNTNAQELVPNGNFNYSDTCQSGSLVSGYMVEPWIEWASPDYYHSCKQASYSIPSSFGGGGQPFEGQGYVGIGVYVSFTSFREFIIIELTEPLVENTDYRGSFHVSMMDSMWFATRNIGAAFTAQEPPQDLNSILSIEPQVKYAGSSYLDNKVGWIKIAGSFTAQGGERYLTIGNFDIDAETDTMFVPGGGVPPSHSEVFWSGAYYYIDGVSVIPDSIYLSIGDHEDVADSFNLYPNPNSGLFTVDIGLGDEDQAELHVWNISGQLVAQQGLSNGQSSIGLDVSNGLYLYVVTINGERRWTGKVSLISN